MERTSEAILALKPVTFHYKDADTKKAENTPQFGLIAEDVAEAKDLGAILSDPRRPAPTRSPRHKDVVLNPKLTSCKSTVAKPAQTNRDSHRPAAKSRQHKSKK